MNNADDGRQTLEDNLGMSKPFGRFRRVFEVVTSNCGMVYGIGQSIFLRIRKKETHHEQKCTLKGTRADR